MSSIMHIPYVYKLTHTPSKKWYVGSHWAKGCYPDDGYMGSSKVIKNDIPRNPLDWTKEIIATGTAREMYELETDILQTSDAKNDPRSFNQHNNDGLGSVWKGPWNKGLKLSAKQAGWTDERRNAARIRRLGKPSAAKGAKWSIEAKAKRSADYTGRKLSVEHCEAIRIAQSGLVHSEQRKAKRLESYNRTVATRKLLQEY